MEGKKGGEVGLEWSEMGHREVKNCRRERLDRKALEACVLEDVWLLAVPLIMWLVLWLLPAPLSSLPVSI